MRLGRARRKQIIAKLGYLIGLCLWDILSDNHDLILPDGRVVHLGSFKGAAGLISDFVAGGWPMDFRSGEDYLDLVCSCFARIFRALRCADRDLGCCWARRKEHGIKYRIRGQCSGASDVLFSSIPLTGAPTSLCHRRVLFKITGWKPVRFSEGSPIPRKSTGRTPTLVLVQAGSLCYIRSSLPAGGLSYSAVSDAVGASPGVWRRMPHSRSRLREHLTASLSGRHSSHRL